jgi:hypothetical protein
VTELEEELEKELGAAADARRLLQYLQQQQQQQQQQQPLSPAEAAWEPEEDHGDPGGSPEGAAALFEQEVSATLHALLVCKMYPQTVARRPALCQHECMMHASRLLRFSLTPASCPRRFVSFGQAGWDQHRSCAPYTIIALQAQP